jgi:transposase
MTYDERMSVPITVAQTAPGYATLHARLAATGVAPTDTLVVLEATDSYWITLATTLVEWGYRVSVVNPKRAHHFAKVLLKRAKTDAIDAHTLARLGAMLQPKPWTPPPAIYMELQQRLVHRDALIATRQQFRNQLYALIQQQHNPAIKPFYDRLRCAGKSSKVARCAAARKLLHIAWAVATKGQPFDPHYHERAQQMVPTG